MKQGQPTFFCDFDGTFIVEDSLDLLFEGHVPSQKIKPVEEKWSNGLIGSRECISSLFSHIDKLTTKDVFEVADRLTPTEGIQPFLKYLSTINARFYIVSDGVDVIINRVLENNDLKKYVTGVFSNKLEFNGNVHNFKPHSQFEDFCQHEHKCALCKRSVVSRLLDKGGNPNTIYIGDGRSDVYGAQLCGIVFAKKSLLADPRIATAIKIPFSNFSTILSHTKKLNSQKQ